MDVLDAATALFGDGPDLGVLQMCARTLAVFFLALAMIRLSGRSTFGQHRPFDACVTVLLGAVLSRAVVGASPFWPTIASATALVVVHRLVGIACFRWPRVETLVAGQPLQLMAGGKPNASQMRRGLVTLADLDEAARKSPGGGSPLRAFLERDGHITTER